MNKQELTKKYREVSRELEFQKQMKMNLCLINISNKSLDEMMTLAEECAIRDLQIKELEEQKDCLCRYIVKLSSSELIETMDGIQVKKTV